jgi:hypothetical protein
MGYKKIIPQMFDVRPVNETGDLDWKRIESIGKSAEISIEDPEEILEIEPKKANVYHMGVAFPSDDVPVFFENEPIQFQKLEEFSVPKGKNSSIPEKNLRNLAFEEKIPKYFEPIIKPDAEKIETPKIQIFEKPIPRKKPFFEPEFVYGKPKQKKLNLKKLNPFCFDFSPNSDRFDRKPLKTALSFMAISLFVAVIIGSVSLASKSLKIKERVLGSSQTGYENLNSAIDSIKNQNFEASSLEFDKAYKTFSQASEELSSIGDIFIDVSKYVPYVSKLSSGKNMVDAGKHISLAGQALSQAIETMKSLKNPLSESGNDISLLDVFESTKKTLKTARSELEDTQKCLDGVKVDDLPQDKQSQFLELKNKLPVILASLDNFFDNSNIFTDILGGNGPRKYLFLFQNNSEMRATGGFIGSYGLLDISNGRIRNFKINGIFDPDGQLQEKIVPPIPIQKISAAWSLHDSNWFPDFPASAEEAISFFEKTGGPTADGVITLTPTVMQKLLEVTGPIEMPDYDLTLDSNNFIEKTQDQVEVKDKDKNNPKQILSDLAPILLDKLFNAKDIDTVSKTVSVLSGALNEKQILIYSQNKDLEKLISNQGWSGEVLNTSKDYLSVINSNINGYKTDAVIKESIVHQAEIQSDGTIIDTVAITRNHTGGDSQYDWYNQVNADYMRVYVPKGSKLISAEGQTREIDNPPLDYAALNFKRDPKIQQEEQNAIVDDSGTRIYDESGKTVFANWVYVSPKESVTVTYKYLLPFKINVNQQKIADSYSLLAQKQSGSPGSQFASTINYPKNYSISWDSPDSLEKSDRQLKFKSDLAADKFIGVVFTDTSNK